MSQIALPLSRRALLSGVSVAGLALCAGRVAAAPVAPSRHRLWYQAPAAEWTQALPLGNGRLGAMVFGGVARDQIQLNEDTIWSGAPYDPVNPKAQAALPEVRRLIFAHRYPEAKALANSDLMGIPVRQAAYQTAGSLMIDMPALAGVQPRDYARSLDIDAALAETVFQAGGVMYRREYLASPVDQVLAMRLTASQPGRISADLSFACPLKQWDVAVAGADTLVLTGHGDPHNGKPGAVHFQVRLKVIHQGGRVVAKGAGLAVEGADAVTLLVAIATNVRRFDDLGADPAALTQAQIAAAARKPFAAIATASTAEHRRLFRRVVLDLGTTPAAALPTDQRIAQSASADDPALAALYFDYGRYLLICSSRPGTQPANLQGIWNDKPSPPWGGKYTININTETNYWPAQPTALPECVEPLVRMVEEMAISGTHTAKAMYGARGWVAHHNTDLWRATAPVDGAEWGMWPTGGAWLCTHLWEHYEYSLDRAYLARVYPVLHGAALFFLDTLQVDPETGCLVTNPSLSPEHAHGAGTSLIHAPTMDNQILRDLFDQAVAAAHILGREDALTAQFTQARARLMPDKVGAQGQLQEWPYDWDAGAPEISHRHVSHLYGLYPSHQIDPARTPELAKAARRTLEIRGDKATGWATAWRINLWARLGEGDHAHAILRFLLGPERTYPNMFDAHPPFQIDGNFGGAAGIAEMLMRNRAGEITLLPALPSAWGAGSVMGLRARGLVGVDLAWAGGKLTQATLRAGVAGRHTIRLGARALALDMQAGEVRRLTAADF